MSEPIFLNARVVGSLENGVFTQSITDQHIFHKYNAKAMDLALYRTLQAKECLCWRLEFKYTGQVLSISFARIGEVGRLEEINGVKQVFVRLDQFDEDVPVLQTKLM